MFLPGSIKRWLEKQRWYIRARYAPPVLNVWLWLRPSVRKELRSQEKLYLPLLSAVSNSSKLVFDIGAHEGFLTAIFAGAGYKVIAAEPAKRNVAILKSRFSNNSNVAVVEAAVADKPGEIRFYETANSHAFGTASHKWKSSETVNRPEISYFNEPVNIAAITLDDLISQYGLPVFIKIDVEGYEEPAIRGLTQKARLISFEAILPAFKTETENCIAHLQSLNEKTVYNFAVNNQLQWDEFAGADKLMNEINQLPPQTIEIFCRM